MLKIWSNMGVIERRTVSSQQIQALTNAVLQADKTQLEKINSDLKIANAVLEQKVKSLQVAVTILLASSGGLGVGLVTSIARTAMLTALTSTIAVFFSVIMASMAILTFMHQ